MINKEQQDRGCAVPGAALAVLPTAAEEPHPRDRVEIRPVTSTYRRYRDRILARSGVASDRAVAFWPGVQGDGSWRQDSCREMLAVGDCLENL